MPTAASARRSMPATRSAARSTVIGLKENSNRRDRRRLCALDRHQSATARGAGLRPLGAWCASATARAGRRRRSCRICRRAVAAGRAGAARRRSTSRRYDIAAAGSPHRWEDYAVGERIDHVRRHDHRGVLPHDRDAALPEHGARPFQPACGEGAAASAGASSMAAMSSAWRGRSASTASPMPSASPRSMAAGTSIRASPATRSMPGARCRTKAALPGRRDVGALRLRRSPPRTVPAAGFPDLGAEGKPDPAVVLDLDYWVLMPRARLSRARSDPAQAALQDWRIGT